MGRVSPGGAVDRSWSRGYGNGVTAGWSSPVARWAHNPKVAGSNPAPATTQIKGLGKHSLAPSSFSLPTLRCTLRYPVGGTRRALRIDDFADSIFNAAARERLIAAFAAYFDDSGTHPESVVSVVAGFIAPVDQWVRFQAEWQECLRAAGLESFRMVDYASQQPPYDWDDSKRKRVLAQLLTTIKLRTHGAFAVAVLTKPYYEARPHIPSLGDLSAYGFAVMQCVKHVGRWSARYASGPVSYVFDAGVSKGQVETIMSYVLELPDYQIPVYSFARPADLSPLQAADVLAYETYKEAIARTTTAPGTPRRAMRHPLKTMANRVGQIHCYDEQTFARFRAPQ